MFTFRFLYFDGRVEICGKVKRVDYIWSGEKFSVASEKILTHEFPIFANLSLYADDAQYLISSKELKSVFIEKEKS